MFYLTGISASIVGLFDIHRFSISKNDSFLFSAADGPDFLSEELDMLKNMKMAIYEERYKDAGISRKDFIHVLSRRSVSIMFIQ